MAEGVLNIDKPAGLTSHDVVDKVRWIVGIRRVGHAGTLDPLATGVLLLCVGRATRLLEYLVGQRKRYRATIHLGQATTTYDAEGEVEADVPVSVSQVEMKEAVERFRGEISQRPPPFSAVKVEGEPLYKRARRGEVVEGPLRQVTVYELSVIEWNSPQLEIELTCSSGTFVRSIAHDLGRELGCGGHISALRRLSIGEFSVSESVTLPALDRENWKQHLMPLDAAVNHLPRIDLSVEQAMQLQHGQSVPAQLSPDNADLARAYDKNGRFVGIVALENDRWRARKIFYQQVA
jgi:tRNA pseudouridine55 synthase